MPRFGLLRFGLPEGGYRVRFRADLSATVMGAASAAKDIRAATAMTAATQGAARMEMDLCRRCAFSEAGGGAASFVKNLRSAPGMREDVRAAAQLVKDIGIHSQPGRIRGANGARFGLLRFGLPGGRVDIHAAVRMSERVGGMFGSGKKIRANGAEAVAAAVRCSATATAGLRARFDGRAVFSGIARLDKDVRSSAGMREAVRCDAHLGKDIQIYGALSEDVRAAARLGKNMGFAPCMAGAALAAVSAVKDIRTALPLAEAVCSVVSPALLDTEVFHLDVTVPPGGVITIDSDHYEVYLDNRRILHLQSGDWICLERNLIDVIVDTGTGGVLSGSALYRERYL